jgi:hypothetical protein
VPPLQTIRIAGKNFGPGVEPVIEYVQYVCAGRACPGGCCHVRSSLPLVRLSVARGCRYGLDGKEYLAEDCSVTTPHSEITCKTIPGAGTGLLWNLKIDGQVSRVSTTDYAAPVITDLVGPGASEATTEGGQVCTCT